MTVLASPLGVDEGGVPRITLSEDVFLRNASDGDYTLGAATASPATDQFGILYVRGDLTVQGLHTFKGLIFVDGDVTLATGAHLTLLGAMMVRDTYTNVGTGKMTLVYSREAALRGLGHVRPWRVLSWADAEVQGFGQ